MKALKSGIRREVRLELTSLTDSQKQEAFLDFGKNLNKFLQNLKLKLQRQDKEITIGVYSPLRDEVSWPIELEKNHIIAFPGMNNNSMSFYVCRSDELSSSDEFGVKILTPPKKNEIVPTVILVPGLSFSKSGQRLGRGKGFYDRYLANFKGVTVGVCFDLQIRDSLPVEKHDRNVDFVVTEKNIFDCASF